MALIGNDSRNRGNKIGEIFDLCFQPVLGVAERPFLRNSDIGKRIQLRRIAFEPNFRQAFALEIGKCALSILGNFIELAGRAGSQMESDRNEDAAAAIAGG